MRRRFAESGLLVTLVSCVCVASAVAQEPLVQFQRIEGAGSFSNYGVDAIAQDPQGFMWFGSLGDGLARFDGYEFRVFSREAGNPDSLSHNDVNHINVARDGQIWISTAGGLNRFDPLTETFSRYLHEPGSNAGPSSNQVDYSLVDRNGTLWVGTDSGLDRLDPGAVEFRHYALAPEEPSGIGPGRAFTLYLDGSDSLWVGTLGGGVLRYEPATDSFTRFMHDPDNPDSISDNNIRDIMEDRAGMMWMATDGGLNRLDRASNTFHRILPVANDPDSLRGNHVGALLEDSLGNFWVSQDQLGVALFDRATETFIHFDHDPADSNSLGAGRLWTMFEDATGVVWFGTNAINKVVPATHAFQVHRNPNLSGREAGELPSVLTTAADGALWMDSMEGIDRFDPGTGAWARFALRPDEPESGHNEAMAVHEDRAGNLWVAYPRFLSRVDHSTGEHLSVPIESRPLCAYMDLQNRMWLCMPFHGFVEINTATGEEIRRLTDEGDSPQHISHSFAYFAFEDAGGRFWIGTYQGLNRFDPDTGTFRRYMMDEADESSISHNDVSVGFEDPSGTVWFGTGNGINRYNPETDDFRRFYNGTTASRNRIDSIASGENGRLWVRHGAGLADFDPGTETFDNLTVGDGLPAELGSAMIRHPDDGLLYVSTAAGLVTFDTSQRDGSRSSLAVALTDFRLFNESVPVSPGDTSGSLKAAISQVDQLVLGPDDSLVSFEFSALDYADPTAIRYAYRLDGLDQDWVETESNRRIATYTNLAPGDYTFRVRAARQGGAWGSNDTTLAITVLPRWWETGWAFAAYLAMALALLLAIVQLRTRTLRTQRLQLEQTVQDRTAALTQQKETIEEQAERLEELLATKDHYFTNVSHEFRTPLTVILTPIQRLLGRASDTEIKTYLRAVERNASRLLRLVDRLLGLSRIEAEAGNETTPYHVASTANVIRESMQSLAKEKSIDISIDIEDDIRVRCAGGALEEILINLLSNAIKFTPAEGNVLVSAVEEDGGIVAISVSDTGPGIPEADQRRIFDRFFRGESADATVPGSGLGLALVRELTVASGGDISLESREGEGTTVVVRLPAAERQAAVHHIEAPDSTAPGANTEATALMSSLKIEEKPLDDALPSVMVIEDSLDLCAGIQSLLDNTMNSRFAHDGRAGLDRAFEEIPDIVICDVSLPTMNGFEVTRQLKEDDRTCHIPVIMLTAHADDDSRLKGLQALADDYVTKPFDENELLQRIDTVLSIREILRNRYSRELHESGMSSGLGSIGEKDQRFMGRVDKALEQHFPDAGFSTVQLADAAAMSERQLQRKFRALMNLTPREYIRTYRLIRAMALLKEGNTVSDTAFQVGFTSMSYFGKCFRAQFGMAPSDVGASRDRTREPGASA